METQHSIWHQTWYRFIKKRSTQFGLFSISFMLLIAFYAPLLSNSNPLMIIEKGQISFPFIQSFLAPLTSEATIERVYNFCAIFLPFFLISIIIKNKKKRYYIRLLFFLLALIPFFLLSPKLETKDWRNYIKNTPKEDITCIILPPIPFGPYEQVAKAYQTPTKKHILGTDKVGRDVLSRIIYGTRISLSVGFFATSLAMSIGILLGMLSGYKGGVFDMIMMRIVEIVMCFPTFLLLLILMVIMMDRGGTHSILLVAFVIGLTGWTGIARLVRGEVMRQKSFAYVTAAQVLGFSSFRIMFRHILPNITAPILISATFGIAGAILAESGLSFLGFGVQPPTASWGELVNQALVYPLGYYHLTLWPGFIIFFTVTTFNLLGEGLRDAFDHK